MVMQRLRCVCLMLFVAAAQTCTAVEGVDSAVRKPTPPGVNLLAADGGFEKPFVASGNDAFPGAWRRFPIDGITQSRMNESRGRRRSGQAAQRITVSRLMNGAPRLSIPIPGGLHAGTDYEVQAWVLSEKRQGRGRLTVHDGKPWFPKNLEMVEREVGQQWRPISLRFRARQDVPESFVGISLDEENTIWVDDVSFRVGGRDAASSPADGSVVRTWTDASGAHEIAARLEAVGESAVTLRKPGGRLKSVALDQLSEADRVFVERIPESGRQDLWRRHLATPKRPLAHGSFEAGRTGWHASGVVFEAVADKSAPHGDRTAKVSWNGNRAATLQSLGFALVPDREYTLSFAVRSADEQLPVTVGIAAAADREIVTKQVTATRAWGRHSVTFTPPPVPDGTYFVVVTPPPTAAVWLDAVEVAEGTGDARYTPPVAIEAGLRIAVEGLGSAAIVAPGDRVRAVLTLVNHSADTVSVRLERRVCDLWDRWLPGTVDSWLQEFPPGTTDVPFTVWDRADATGAFRVEVEAVHERSPPAALDTGTELYAESLLSVLPTAVGASSLGTTLDYNLGGARVHRRAGYGWTKTWWLDWGRAQPAADAAFAFTPQQDARVDDWAQSGFATLGILSQAPAWAQVFQPDWGWANPRDAAAQSAYAAAAVRHFGDRVPVWELQNEPNQEVQAAKGESRAVAYAREAAALAAGAWSADPRKKLLLGSLTVRDEFGPFFDEIFAAQPALKARDAESNAPRLYGVSFHFYTADPAVIRRSVADIRGMLARQGLERLAIWDTEWAPMTRIRTLKRALRRGPTDHAVAPRLAASLAFQGFVARLGEGVETAVLYDTYNTGDMRGVGHKMLLELDGSLSPVAAAVSTLARHLTGITRREALEADRIWAYRFHRDDGCTVTCAWTDDRVPEHETRPLVIEAGGTVHDMMGNSIGDVAAGAALAVGADPVLVVSPAAKRSDGDE